MKKKLLSSMKENETAIIKSIDKEIEFMLAEKGMYKGVEISLFKKCIYDNYCILIDNRKIALHKKISEKIEIE